MTRYKLMYIDGFIVWSYIATGAIVFFLVTIFYTSALFGVWLNS